MKKHGVSHQARIKKSYCSTDLEKKEVTQAPPVKEKLQFSAINKINFSVLVKESKKVKGEDII